MGGVIEAGGALLSQAAVRLEINALNIANAGVPGYRAMAAAHSGGSSFSSLLSTDSQLSASDNLTAGQTRSTDSPLDVAILGSAFFAIRGEAGTLYSRNGQFHRNSDGRLVNAEGLSVQGTEGDIVLQGESPQILTDGTILENGEPVARIALMVAASSSALHRAGNDFSADPSSMRPAESATVMQGMLETSNVSMAQEMLSMMQAQRSAESGQALVRLYDDLMGRALVAFGQAGS